MALDVYREIPSVLISTALGLRPRAVLISTSGIFPVYRLKPCVNLYVYRCMDVIVKNLLNEQHCVQDYRLCCVLWLMLCIGKESQLTNISSNINFSIPAAYFPSQQQQQTTECLHSHPAHVWPYSWSCLLGTNPSSIVFEATTTLCFVAAFNTWQAT